MNYTEWVLERGKTLWHERERALEERLALRTPNGREAEKARTETGETQNEQQTERADGKTTDAAEEEENAAEEVRRLLRGLGLFYGEEEKENGQGGIAALAAPEEKSGKARETEDGTYGRTAAAWIWESLETDGTAGAAAAADAERERTVFVPAREREGRETESFSLSLERDARRYDGGFLYY